MQHAVLKVSFAEKRAAAQKAEADFFALLRESGLAKPGAVWKEVSGILLTGLAPFNRMAL